jgi:preprotein translocase subunit SecE
MKEKIVQFFNDVLKEMRKVTWPTRDELKDSTMVVLATSVILALFVLLIDTVMTQILGLVMGG